MADLVAAIRAAIDDAEQNARWVHRWDCDGLMGVGGEYGTCDCPEPELRRRRCAADRKILDLHAGSEGGARCGSCADVDLAGIWRADRSPCATLLALAEAYGVEDIPVDKTGPETA